MQLLKASTHYLKKTELNEKSTGIDNMPMQIPSITSKASTILEETLVQMEGCLQSYMKDIIISRLKMSRLQGAHQ